jgi:hypothetical protein
MVIIQTLPHELYVGRRILRVDLVYLPLDADPSRIGLTSGKKE